MQLAPRYLDRPLILLDGEPNSIAQPTITQRQRLANSAVELGDALLGPSRCEGWSGLDVLAHLDGTNRFWSMSIAAAVAGEPSRVLAGFDPVATPAAMVDAGRDRPAAEVLDSFVESTNRLVDDIAAIPTDDWNVLGEAPPGHMTIGAVMHHALWDSWVHERDVLLPLDVTPVEEPDEIRAALRYAAALSPALGTASGRRRTGQVVVAGNEPDVVFAVTVDDDVAVSSCSDPGDDTVVRGSSVALLEAFSARGPFPSPVDDSWGWILQGLAEAFDQA